MNDNSQYKFLTQKELREMQNDISHAVTIFYSSIAFRTDPAFLDRDQRKDPDIKLLMRRYLDIEELLNGEFDENGNGRYI